jgi:hypothetical protein
MKTTSTLLNHWLSNQPPTGKKILQFGVLVTFFTVFLLPVAKADYTVAAGVTIDASTITGQTGVLTINGTLNLSVNTVLSGFTSVIINGPVGQIYWTANKDLKFNASTTFVINTPGVSGGLQPTGTNGAKTLTIGTIVMAVSNDNSNNAAFSFEEFNGAGGLPQFLFSSSAGTICYGTTSTVTITPTNNTIDYDCTFSINNSGSISPSSVSNFNSPQIATVTPVNTNVQKTYTISCTVKRAGDNDPIVTKTVTVIVNPAPAVPTTISATPSSICLGSSSNLNATSFSNTIAWYTVSTGGASIGSSASAANFSVSPAATTTYYAGSVTTSGTGCTSTTRLPTAVTVSTASVGGTVSSNANICSGSNSTVLTLSGHTGSITWESSLNNFATAGTNITNNTTTLTATNLTATTYYRSVITNGGCSSAYSSVVVLTVSNAGTWLGANTDWNSTLNWCNGTIPTSTTNVTIPTGLTFYPTITGTAFTNNITVATGGSALVTVTGILKIAGAISSTNGIAASTGTVEMTGTSAQTISGNNFVSNSISNLKLSNTLSSASSANPSVTINSAAGMMKISGTVSFGSLNNAVLKTNDNLTLLSSASATASISDVTNNSVNSGNNIVDKVVIERYIPGRRAWRLLAPPVTTASSVKISSSWQESATAVINPAIINSSNNPNPGYGTHITFGNPATNGYDQGINGNTSIRYLTSTGWDAAPTSTTGVNVTDQPGYFVFVRGDRSTLLSSGTGASISPTVLRTKGNINVGQVDLALGTDFLSGTSHFRVLRNPYASALNFHKVKLNAANSGGGFADAFYAWDPNVTGTNGVGGWVAMSYNSITGSYDRTVASGGSSSIDNSGDIQSGSAFMIDYNGSASSIRMLESNKNSGSNNTAFRPGKLQKLRVTLLAKNADNSISTNDGALITFNELFSNAIDEMDMKKMNNFAENFGIQKNAEVLMLERRQVIQRTDTIAFNMSQMKQKNYQLQFEIDAASVSKGTEVILEDRFVSTKTVVKLDEKFTYNFNVTNGNTSNRTDRFRLLFQPSLEFLNIKGIELNNTAVIKWQVANQSSIAHYEVERSPDGKSFATVGLLQSKADNDYATAYTFTDSKPVADNSTYRVKSTNKNGAFTYSDAVSLKVINSKKGMYIFPNPVTNNIISLQLNRIQAGTYSVRLIDVAGVVISSKTIECPGGSVSTTIEPTVYLTAGTYRLQVVSPDNTSTSLPCIVVQK